MWVDEQRAEVRATAAKWGLEVAKARQAKIEAGLWEFLANTEAALQKSMEALEPEHNALELERNALES